MVGTQLVVPCRYFAQYINDEWWLFTDLVLLRANRIP